MNKEGAAKRRKDDESPEEPKSLEDVLRNSWKTFRSKLPGDLGDLLDPRVAIERIVIRNGKALIKELLESGEALGLLAKLSATGSLTDKEKARLKEQLLDIGRSIPALGIFALPGGMLLLPILARCLPWEMVPSAFRSKAKTAEGAETSEPGERPNADGNDKAQRPD